MATIREFIEFGALYYAEKIKENSREMYKNMHSYKPSNKKELQKELLFLEYFIWDYMLHFLHSKCKSENRDQEAEIYTKFRDGIVAIMCTDKNFGINMEQISDSCDAYKKALSIENEEFKGEKLMKLGAEFGKRSDNPDPLIELVAAGHYANTLNVMLPNIEKLTRDFLNGKE